MFFFKRPDIFPRFILPYLTLPRLLLFLFFFGLLQKQSFAHPHVFVDARVKFVTDQTGLSGIWMYWIFDEFFSESIRFDYDTNKDKKFSPEEKKKMAETISRNLGVFSFFTHIYVKKKYHSVSKVEKFTIQFKKDGKALFSFFIPFRLPYPKKKTDFFLATFDETFFTAIEYNKTTPVSLENKGKTQLARAFLRENKESFLGPLPTEGWIKKVPYLFILELKKS